MTISPPPQYTTATIPCPLCYGTGVNRFGHCACLCGGSGKRRVLRPVELQPALFDAEEAGIGVAENQNIIST